MAADLDQKSIEALLSGGESSRGNFSLKETKKEDDPINHKNLLDSKMIKVIEPLGKYKQSLVDDVKKHPDQFTIMTPKGRMTVKAALARGFNPQTGEFDGVNIQEEKQKIMQNQNPRNRKVLKRLTDPKTARVPEMEAEELGLDPTNKMVKKRPMPEKPVEEEAMPGEEPEMDPNAMAEMLGGM